MAEFLRDCPLYTPLTLKFAEPMYARDLTPEPFPRYCSNCRRDTTWVMSSSTDIKYGSPELYCAQCRTNRLRIYIGFEPSPFEPNPTGGQYEVRRSTFTLRKIGQWPAWSISPAPEIQAALSEADLDLYKKALVCMSQGYGLGAVAYFRRMVENETVAMLDLVEDAATTDQDSEALESVRKARESRVAEDKLRLIAEHVPRTLRPGGVNPLAALYDQFSRGIHGLSDDECLEIALRLRADFDFIFKNLRQLARETKEYAARITALAAAKK